MILASKSAVMRSGSFEDGEHKARPLVSVRSKDAYVVQSLHAGPQASANDKLCKLLFFLSTLRENGAARITALVPYLAYARKDRQFARMKAGTRVVFKEEPGEQGPQASTVTLMGKHGLK